MCSCNHVILPPSLQKLVASKVRVLNGFRSGVLSADVRLLANRNPSLQLYIRCVYVYVYMNWLVVGGADVTVVGRGSVMSPLTLQNPEGDRQPPRADTDVSQDRAKQQTL